MAELMGKAKVETMQKCTLFVPSKHPDLDFCFGQLFNSLSNTILEFIFYCCGPY